MDLNRFSLGGKVALITGGTVGLGRAIAQGYSDAGARVVVTSRTPAERSSAPDPSVPYAAVLQMDVRSEESVQAAVNSVVDQFGRLDILVNNAGQVAVERAWQADAESWRAVVETNLTGAFLCAKHVSQAMIATGGGGKIINISSVIALLGPSDFASYAATKAGLLGLTRALAVELARFDIQVNAILPGYFHTDMSAGVPDWLREQIILKTPAARWGDPDELVGAAILLASRASQFMTGSTVTVDGGYSIAERLRYDTT